MRRFYPLLLAFGVAVATVIGCNLTDAQGSPAAGEEAPAVRPAGSATPDSNSSDASEGSPSATAPTTSAAAETDEVAVPVEVFEVSPHSVDEEINATGELRANEQVDLRAEASGRIVGLHFEEGQRVKADALLVKVDDADLRAELRRVRAQKGLAERREERSRALLAESTISQEVYDEANSQLQVLGAQEEQLEARIRKTEVRAPFDGVVGLRAISEGSYVTPAQSIASLQNLDPIKIDFAVPEKYAGEIGPGDRLEFEVAGNSGTHTAEVYAVEPRIDPQTRTVQVRARARNSAEKLLPGAFARVRLVTRSEADALSVPAISLVPTAESTHVFVVDADDRAEIRIVETAKRSDREVQITRGLEPGDRVIVSGVLQVRPGTLVEVRKVSR